MTIQPLWRQPSCWFARSLESSPDQLPRVRGLSENLCELSLTAPRDAWLPISGHTLLAASRKRFDIPS